MLILALVDPAQNNFPEWLYQFTLTQAVSENYIGFISWYHALRVSALMDGVEFVVF